MNSSGAAIMRARRPGGRCVGSLHAPPSRAPARRLHAIFEIRRKESAMEPDDETKSESEPEDTATQEHRKPRRHGYRGYPNNPQIGGKVHSGSGFGGVGSTTPGGNLGESSVVGEKTRASVEELGEDEEEEKK